MVCAMVFQRGVSEAGDFRQNLVCCLGPYEGLRVIVASRYVDAPAR